MYLTCAIHNILNKGVENFDRRQVLNNMIDLKSLDSTLITKISLKKGEILYHAGDKPDSVYFIEEGLVGLFHLSEDGKETFLRVFDKDNILGHRSYFANEEYHATSMALTNVIINSISTKTCDQICESSPKLIKEVTKIIAKDLKIAELRLANLKDHSAQKRIIESMVYLKLKYPTKVWTRKQISDYSCTSFESVTRVMTKLEAESLIDKKGRDFNIPNIEKLLEYT